MFSKRKVFHCELYGNETTIEKTRVLTKIKGVINLKLFNNPHIDYEGKIIYSSTNKPIKYFSKLHTPEDLKDITGDLYTIVDDFDELEQSTCILSDKAKDFVMGNQIIKFVNYLESSQIVNFPETMFFTSVNETFELPTSQEECKNWKILYHSIGRKYYTRRIIDSRKESMTYGVLDFGHGLLHPGYNVGVSDISQKNINGTGYQFKTEKKFIPTSFCSNESVVEYCIKNNLIAYYVDFLNGGKLRILCEFTENINNNLNNKYKFRSLFI